MNKRYDYVIIGAGFAGMCMAIKLKEAGLNNFIILERDKWMGGTWYANSYPGAVCDVQSHLYSYSFELKPDWSRLFGPQEEILHYMEHCSEKYGLKPHFQFKTNVTGAEFDETNSEWNILTSTGITYTGKFFISCSGGLSQPAFPEIKGWQNFRGKVFHSAQWDHTFDLKGKTVAVIGTGASAIQIVPSIAADVGKLHLYQRTPAWVIPKPDRKVTEFEKKMFSTFPFTQSLFRGFFYWRNELFAVGFISNQKLLKLARKLALKHLETVKDEALRKKLTPNYMVGCKRVLLSNDYYPVLQRDNVEVITEHIQEVNETGVITADGKHRRADAIIFATGFNATEGVVVFDIKGKNGLDMNQAWKDGAEAYLGTSIAGFPNFFLIVGPNTGLGHTSLIIMIEAQAHYIMECIKTIQKNNWKSIDVKQDVQKEYNDEIQKSCSIQYGKMAAAKAGIITVKGRMLQSGRHILLLSRKGPGDLSRRNMK